MCKTCERDSQNVERRPPLPFHSSLSQNPRLEPGNRTVGLVIMSLQLQLPALQFVDIRKVSSCSKKKKKKEENGALVKTAFIQILFSVFRVCLINLLLYMGVKLGVLT